MQQQQLQFQKEKYKIIYLKDDRGEDHTLRVLLSCCYKNIEISNSSYWDYYNSIFVLDLSMKISHTNLLELKILT